MESLEEGPRILLLDIETAAVLGWSWVFHDTNLIDTFRDWSILCYAWKWHGEKDVQVHSIPRPKDIWDFLRHPDNDNGIVKELWRLIDQADFVVAHNGKSFDCKKIQSRFLHYGMPPPSPFKVVDTLTETKRISNNTRNNQDALLKSWGLGAKLENSGWPMWFGCMSGSEESWQEMEMYNKIDVEGLSKLFDHLRPWISGVSSATYYPKTICPKPGCGSTEFTRSGLHHNKTTTYVRLKCKRCFGWSMVPINLRELKPLKPL